MIARTPMLERIEPQTVRQWQAMQRVLFGDRNRLVHSPESITHKLITRISHVQQAIKRGGKLSPFALACLASVGGRIFTISNFFEIDLASALLKKHPGKCTRCNQEVCICGKVSNKRRRVHLIEDLELSAQLVTLNNSFTLLTTTYHDNNVRCGGASFTVGRLLEEAGEACCAIDPDTPREELEGELADVFAWWIATCDMLGIENLQDFMWAYYSWCCSVCHHCPCDCTPSYHRR